MITLGINAAFHDASAVLPFNVRGEPIACTFRNASDVPSTPPDALVIGRLVRRKPTAGAAAFA